MEASASLWVVQSEIFFGDDIQDLDIEVHGIPKFGANSRSTCEV